jgi:uncharacterized protein
MRAALLLTLLWLTLPATAAPFLWQYQGPKATHHFIGSVHLLPEQAQPLPAALLAAADASQVLVFESDIEALADPAVQLRMAAAAESAEGLRAEIGAPMYQRLQARLTSAGLPDLLCERFRAWMCSMMLEVTTYLRQGFRPELGIDQQLARRAAGQDKPRQSLETLDEHLGLFTGMSPAMSVAFLQATLDELEGEALSPEKLLRLWQRGDMVALTALVQEMKAEQAPAYERLLAGRNRAWLPRIEARLRGAEPTLFVVGAAHFAGPDGLLDLLKARGRLLRPVSAADRPQAGPGGGVRFY